MSTAGNSSSLKYSSQKNQKKSHRKWSQEAMQRAYEDCIQRGLPCRTSSKKHGVPRTTLRDRLTLRVQPNCKQGRTTHLSEEQEKYLIDYITFMSLQGFIVTVQQVINEAWAIDQNGRNAFGEKGPSSNWWFRFNQRHPKVKNILSYPNLKDKTFLGLVNNLRGYFQHLKAVYDKSNFVDRPQDIYYCDEVLIDQTKLTKQVLIPRRLLHVHQVNSSEHFSIHNCVSASGRALPPFFTLRYPLCYDSSIDDDPTRASYNCHEAGLMNPELFLRWLQTVFVPLSLPSPAKPVLLLLDGHRTQCSINVVEEAVKSNIILMAAAPPLSPLCQPLDVIVYKSLKWQLENLMLLGGSSKGNLWLTTNNVPKIVKAYTDSISVKSDIEEGFKRCGISPFNPNAVDKSQLGHDKMIVGEDVDLSIVPQMNYNGSDVSSGLYGLTANSSTSGTPKISNENECSFDKPASDNNSFTSEKDSHSMLSLECGLLPSKSKVVLKPAADDNQITEQSSISFLPKVDAQSDNPSATATKVREQAYPSLASSSATATKVREQAYPSLASSSATETKVREQACPSLASSSATETKVREQAYPSLASSSATETKVRGQAYTTLTAQCTSTPTAATDCTLGFEIMDESLLSKTTASSSSEKERCPCDYVKFMASKGFTVTSDLIKRACTVEEKNRLKMLGEEEPMDYWFKKFIHEHSDIKKMLSRHNLKKSETLFGVINSIRGYFRNLQTVLVLGKLLGRPQDIYYCDEVLVNPHKSLKPIVIPRRQLSSNKATSPEHFSIQCCVSAAGYAMPPLFTFKSTIPHVDCTNDRPNSVAFDCQEFMTPSLFLKWFQRVFVPLSKPEFGKPVLLLLDCKGSQCSPELLLDAAKNNVIIIAAGPPPISLQPLDILAYKFLKLRLDNLATVGDPNVETLWISKNDVPRNMTSYVESIMSPYNIREGFRQCGIYPFNPNAINTDQLPGIKSMPNSDELLDFSAPPLEDHPLNEWYVSKLFWIRISNKDTCGAKIHFPSPYKSSARSDVSNASSSVRVSYFTERNDPLCFSRNPSGELYQSSPMNYAQTSSSAKVKAVEGLQQCQSSNTNVCLKPELNNCITNTKGQAMNHRDDSIIQGVECSSRKVLINCQSDRILKLPSLRLLPHRMALLQDIILSSGTHSCGAIQRPEPGVRINSRTPLSGRLSSSTSKQQLQCTASDKRKHQPEPECTASDKRKHQPEPECTASDKRKQQPEPECTASDKRKQQPKPECTASDKRRQQPKPECTAFDKRKQQPEPECTVSNKRNDALDEANRPRKQSSLLARSSCIGYGEGSSACFKCHKLWDDEPRPYQSNWINCQSPDCYNWICPQCLPPGFDYEHEHYYCINSAMIKVEM